MKPETVFINTLLPTFIKRAYINNVQRPLGHTVNTFIVRVHLLDVPDEDKGLPPVHLYTDQPIL